MEQLAGGVIFAVIGGVVAAMFFVPIYRRHATLRRLAERLGGTRSGGLFVRTTLDATVEGVAVRLRYAGRGHDEHRTRWTYVDVPLPAGEAITLAVMRHGWFERGQIARGTMIDLATGDAEFDRLYRVEAAPAAVVTAMLDEPLRGFLREYDAELTTKDGTLRLAVRAWLSEEAAMRAIELATRAIAAAREAHAALYRVAPGEQVGPAHRGVPSDAGVRGARDAHAAEVAEVDRLLRRRAWIWRLAGVAFTAIVLAAAFATQISFRAIRVSGRNDERPRRAAVRDDQRELITSPADPWARSSG